MNSPILFVVYLRQEEVTSFLSSLSDPAYSLLCNHRIRLFLYIVDPSHKFYTQFPINILRNIGIMHVRTSHFAVLDIDMWLSGRKWRCVIVSPSSCEMYCLSVDQSYETVLKTPPEVTEDPKTVIIIPAFFHTGWKIANGTLEEQVES